MEQKKFHIMVNGLPGNMAQLIFLKLLGNPNYSLMDHSLTGPDSTRETFRLSTILHKPPHQEILSYLLSEYRGELIAIDFTQPSAIMENARLYCENKIPFVMGTTGGNREVLHKMVEQSETSAVIAPNMSVPIVMMMNMFEFAANNYPGALHGWDIRITESHQSGKKDVSGTAIAIGKILKSMGVNYSQENIRSVRDKIEQLFMGIQGDALSGHGWHKYSLVSPDGKVQLGFEHNINGRNTYVDGTLMALDFLAVMMEQGVKGQCFSMNDVIRG